MTTIERPTLVEAKTTEAASTFKFSNGSKVRTTKRYRWLFVRTYTNMVDPEFNSARVYRGTDSLNAMRRELAAAKRDSKGVGSHRFDYHCLHITVNGYEEVTS